MSNKKNRNKPVITFVKKEQMPLDHVKFWLERNGCHEDGIGTMFYCKVAYKGKELPMMTPAVLSCSDAEAIKKQFGEDQIEPTLAGQAIDQIETILSKKGNEVCTMFERLEKQI